MNCKINFFLAIATTTPAAATTTPGASSSLATQPTATPAKPTSVPTPSTLKNKSMEDVLNMWTKELEKQTTEFHKQASQVAQWDQQLIENGNKVSTYLDDLFADINSSLDLQFA